jgi:hypothetical protein
MDVMIHASITAIRYSSSTLDLANLHSSGIEDEGDDMIGSENVPANGKWFDGSAPSTVHDTYYTADDSPYVTPGSSPTKDANMTMTPSVYFTPKEAATSSTVKLILTSASEDTSQMSQDIAEDTSIRPVGLLQLFDSEINDNQSVPPLQDTKSIIHSMSGVSKSDIIKVYDKLSEPIIANYDMLVRGSKEIFDMYTLTTSKVPAGSSANEQTDKKVLYDECYLVQKRDDIINNLMACESIPDLKVCLLEHFNKCNENSSIRFTDLFQTLPHVLPTIKQYLYHKYIYDIRSFWKAQTVVHTCRFVNY